MGRLRKQRHQRVHAGPASNTTPASAAIMRGVAGANGQTYYLGTYSDGRETALTYQAYDPTNGFSATRPSMLGTSDVGGGRQRFTAAQLGTSLTLDAGDSRIQSLAYASSGGRNYVYGVSEVMPSSGSLAQIEWFKLDVTDPANPQYVLQRQRHYRRIDRRRERHALFNAFDRRGRPRRSPHQLHRLGSKHGPLGLLCCVGRGGRQLQRPHPLSRQHELFPANGGIDRRAALGHLLKRDRRSGESGLGSGSQTNT